MSTRCDLVALMPDGKLREITVNFNGHPRHIIPILSGHYSNADRVFELMSLGNLSSIAESPQCPEGHSYETPVAGYCIAYHRDRGEDLEFREFNTDSEYMEQGAFFEFTYYWNGCEWCCIIDGCFTPFELVPR